MKRVLMLAVVLAATSAQAERYKALPTAQDNAEMEQQLKPGSEVGLDAFLKSPQRHHWVAFYEAADQLFKQGRKDEALQWYYAGQIRARVAAGLDPDASRNNAMMVAMNEGIGTPIMDYAKADQENWGRQIDAALAWDKAHPLPNDPKEVIGISEVVWDSANFFRVYQQVRDGLAQMRQGLK